MSAHRSSHVTAHALSTCVASVVSMQPPCSNTPCTQKAVAGASCSRVRDKGRGQAHAWEAAGGWSPGAFLPSLKSGTRRAPFVQDSTRLLLTPVLAPRLSSPLAASKDRPARLLPLDPVRHDGSRSAAGRACRSAQVAGAPILRRSDHASAAGEREKRSYESRILAAITRSTVLGWPSLVRRWSVWQ
jgi:hypothetical protein